MMTPLNTSVAGELRRWMTTTILEERDAGVQQGRRTTTEHDDSNSDADQRQWRRNAALLDDIGDTGQNQWVWTSTKLDVNDGG